MKPATWKIKTVFFKGLFSIFSFMYQNLCPFDKLMLCARLWFCYNSFGRFVNWKKLLTFHMKSFLPSFTLHLNVSSAVHGRIDMKCTANPCERSRKNNHVYLRQFTTKLQQNFSNTLRYMKGNHWIERILSRSTHANFFRNWVIHMNWVSERCSTNEQTIDTSVQPSGSLISKGTVSDAYAHGPLETEMFITNATNEWPHRCPAKKRGKHKRHK